MERSSVAAPKEDDVISAGEETLQFDEAPEEDDVTSAAEETLQFDEAPEEDDVTSAGEESFQFDDDNLRGEEKMCFTYHKIIDVEIAFLWIYMYKPLPVSC